MRCRPDRLLAAAAGALVALAGVAAVAAPPGAAPALHAGGACCRGPEEFHYEALPASGVVEFAIGHNAPVFEFQSGLSRFQAFALPARTASYTLEIRSYIEQAADPVRAHLFYPAVAVLSDDFLVTRSTGPDRAQPDLPLLEHAGAPAYRLVMPFKPGVGRERYLVVFTPAVLTAPRALPAAPDPDSAARAARESFLGAAAYGRLSITVRDGARAGAEEAREPAP